MAWDLGWQCRNVTVSAHDRRRGDFATGIVFVLAADGAISGMPMLRFLALLQLRSRLLPGSFSLHAAGHQGIYILNEALRVRYHAVLQGPVRFYRWRCVRNDDISCGAAWCTTMLIVILVALHYDIIVRPVLARFGHRQRPHLGCRGGGCALFLGGRRSSSGGTIVLLMALMQIQQHGAALHGVMRAVHEMVEQTCHVVEARHCQEVLQEPPRSSRNHLWII